ncbi:hypothetical protein SDC9_25596 [bioreactor metagenome]|uniref:Uncharacterized protein n=1 Tax=bioreactor metagenome TaxID=1076179 RepID=A0A644ULS3_9ZZZZ
MTRRRAPPIWAPGGGGGCAPADAGEAAAAGSGRDADPPSLGRGTLDRLDETLDPQPRGKAEGFRDFARDRTDIAFDLDRLQVVETDLVARGDAEAAIGRVIGGGLDPAEAAPAGGVGGRVEMQLVEALLAEGERALRAIDLEVMLHLASGGDPVALDRALRAILKTQEGAADVIHRDRAAAALAVGPFADHRDAVAHHLGNRTEQEFGGGQRMAADIGERSAPRRIVAEGPGAGGIGHVILGMQPAIAADLAQFAGRDHLARQPQHRVAQIVEADLRLHCLRRRRIGHLARLGRARRKRLLAIDMLARGDRGEGHLLVQRVRRSDVDHVDLGGGD